MTPKKHHQAIVRFIGNQMEGEPIPAATSPEMKGLIDAVRYMQAGGDPACATLGVLVLGLVIDRMGAGIQVEAAIKNFTRFD